MAKFGSSSAILPSEQNKKKVSMDVGFYALIT